MKFLIQTIKLKNITKKKKIKVKFLAFTKNHYKKRTVNLNFQSNNLKDNSKYATND